MRISHAPDRCQTTATTITAKTAICMKTTMRASDILTHIQRTYAQCPLHINNRIKHNTVFCEPIGARAGGRAVVTFE